MSTLDRAKILTLAVLFSKVCLLFIVFGKPDQEPLANFLLLLESAEKIVVLCKSDSKRQEDK